jgi:23S rRNA (guanosine2251-2'-O)-methyltransferase
MAEMIIGRNPVAEALRSDRAISRILVAQGTPESGIVGEIIRLAHERQIPIEFAARNIMDKEAGNTTYQGVIAYASPRKELEFDDLIGFSKEKNEAPLYVILDGIEDPHNFGAIIRTADAAGIQAIIIRARREVGVTPVVVKASAGAVEYVPVVVVSNIAQAIIDLQKAGVWIVGIEAGGKTLYSSVDFKPPTAIVVGGEGGGVSDLVKKRCDILASIPMHGQISSLNASVAAAIVMYEAFRQRTDNFKVK